MRARLVGAADARTVTTRLNAAQRLLDSDTRLKTEEAMRLVIGRSETRKEGVCSYRPRGDSETRMRWVRGLRGGWMLRGA